MYVMVLTFVLIPRDSSIVNIVRRIIIILKLNLVWVKISTKVESETKFVKNNLKIILYMLIQKRINMYNHL